MYLDQKIPVPLHSAGVTRKTINGVTYVYFTYSRSYDASKKYTKPVNTTIGKCDTEDPSMMYPNTNFLRFFPDIALPEEKEESVRSGCLRIGTFIVIRRIVAEYHLDEILERIIGRDSGLFLDIAAYTIVAENNAAQYYPDYAYNHPLFTSGMRMYSDSKVSDFLQSITRDQSYAFQEEWNEERDHRERIYISYDSTNKNCQAGDLDLVEYGHPKEKVGAPIVNYSIAYDCCYSEPLFYEAYSGSIVDVSQLQIMLEKAKGYGYRHIGFVLDRGYFSEPNIHYMDKCGYAFVLMMKGQKDLVRSLILEVKGTFEEKRENSIRDFKVSGITVSSKMFPSDKKNRYFHIYYDDYRKGREHEDIELKVDLLSEVLRQHEGKAYPNPGSNVKKYFELLYTNPGKPDAIFNLARERYDVINEEIKYCGYFVIITSEKMTAEEALRLYKGRDASEKLFRGDKSYLGNKSFRVSSNESLHAKIFIEFVALIIRNRIHTLLKEQIAAAGKKRNYMNVPAAIRELEKIELVRQADRNYVLDHAVTATQKTILKAFDMDAQTIRTSAIGINDSLIALKKEAM